jgi:polar amino acid transport system substrate-binding protein
MGKEAHMKKRWMAAVALLSVFVLVATACAKKSTTGGGGASASASASGGGFGVAEDPKIAAELPRAIAAKGALIVAVDATYAPNEFIPPGQSQPQGMTIDLGHAIGNVLGLEFNFQNATFDSIIVGLASGKYDLGMSSFTDTKEREKTVDFVTYFSAGTSFYVAASGGPNVSGLDSLCGLKVGAERGTTQAHDATVQSKKCTAAGKPAVSLSVFPDQNGANLALSAGRVQVVMADSPVAAYAVKQSNGQFKLVGTPYGTAPYGIAIPRPKGVAPGQAPMSKPIMDAVNKLIQDGTYLKILEKWGLQEGAIKQAVINGAIY